MLRIRLTRTGKKAQISFRIVVADHRKAVKKQALEVLGYYIPGKNPKVLSYNAERVQHWIKNGAQPSESVASLLKKDGVAGMEKYIAYSTDRKGKKKKGGEAESAAA